MGSRLTPSRVRPSRRLRRQSRILTLCPKTTSTMTITTLGIISTAMARAISLSSILASLTACSGIRTTWLRTPSIRAIPAVRTRARASQGYATCPTSRVKPRKKWNYKVPGGARRGDAGDFMMQIGSKQAVWASCATKSAHLLPFVQVVPAMGRFLTMRQDVYLRFLLTQIWLWLAPLG